MMKLQGLALGFCFFLLCGISTVVGQGQQTGITGRVYDAETKAPLYGVSVRIKGSEAVASTDETGSFSLAARGDTSRRVIVVLTYMGYHSREVEANIGTVIEVSLEAAPSELDEVVVIGYGTVKRRDLTGAVSSVKAEEIAFAPVANPVEALQGRVAGLDIARTSGRATSGSSILLRGNRSLTAGSNPIYIIDGIQGDITNLNPNDIESIDVLKDASSTAIYGSAGANGVIIITTKQAAEGQVRLDFDAYLGVNSNGRYPAALQGDAWLTYMEESFKSTNGRAPENRDELLTAWSLNPELINRYIDNGQWIDWVDETLHTGVQQNYLVSVKGGTDKTQGFFSLGYNSTQGIYKNDKAQLYTARGGVVNKINHWFTGGINAGLTWKDNEARPSRVNRTFSSIPVGEVYDQNGNINTYPIAGLTAPSLIVDDIPNTLRNNSKNFVVTLNPHVDLDIAKGLTFRSILGTTLDGSRTGIFNSDRTYMMLSGSSAQVRNATYSTGLGYGYIWENIANYQTRIGNDHDINATLISSWAHNQRESSSGYNEAFLYDEFLFYSLQAGTNPYASSGYNMTKRMSVAGRLNYSYKSKYLLSLTNRTDGVSQLASRWDSFLAGAAAWRISDEAFMESARSVVNNMKLRASYGVSGNSNINAYSTLTEVTSTGLDAINLGGGLLTTSVLTQAVGNPALAWEKSYNLNIGLDLGLFDNRVEAVVEWYDTDTRDVLYARNLPFSSGGFTPKIPYQMTANLARMHNRGIEATLTGKVIQRDRFRWNTTVTFAYNREQVKSIDLGSGITVDDLISLGLFMGRPSNMVFGYKKLGIWQLGEEADAAVFGLNPGDVRVQSNLTKVRDGVWVDNTAETPVEYTADNPYTISPSDRTVIGQGSPLWTAGWQHSFYWNGFDLNVFAIARWGHYINSALLGYFSYGGANLPSNYDYWTSENPTNDYPRPYLNRTASYSNPVLGLNEVDGSFIKIKNITLGYTLPERVGQRMGLSRYRVYTTMHNPFIYTRSHLLKGMDPETGAGDEFPLYRQLVFGINMSF